MRFRDKTAYVWGLRYRGSRFPASRTLSHPAWVYNIFNYTKMMILAGWLKSNCIFDVVIIYFSQQSGIDCVTEDLSQKRQDAVTIKFGQQSIEIVCVHHISHRLYVWLNDSESIAIILYSQLNLVNNQVNLSAFTVSPSVPASEHQLIWGGWQSGRRAQE